MFHRLSSYAKTQSQSRSRYPPHRSSPCEVLGFRAGSRLTARSACLSCRLPGSQPRPCFENASPPPRFCQHGHCVCLSRHNWLPVTRASHMNISSNCTGMHNYACICTCISYPQANSFVLHLCCYNRTRLASLAKLLCDNALVCSCLFKAKSSEVVLTHSSNTYY